MLFLKIRLLVSIVSLVKINLKLKKKLQGYNFKTTNEIYIDFYVVS